MKAATTQGFGTNAVLIVQDTKRPPVGPDEVLVEVYASSVNPKDWKLNFNISAFMPKLGGLITPFIIGDDLAGIVVEKGSKVTGFELGDEVYGMNMRLRTTACAEYASIGQRFIAHKPKNITFKEAASVPLAAQTALQAFQIGGLNSGDKILIVGASGGVGTFAVQIAKAMGAHVTGVCSGRNTEMVTRLGADEVIDYTTQDYLNDSASNNKSFDMVLDATSYESLSSCSSLLKENGIYVTTAGNGTAHLNLIKDNLRYRKQKSKVVIVDSITQDLETLKGFIEQGLVKPVVDGEYSLENIHDAYLRSKTGRAAGKIVINIKESEEKKTESVTG
ncbi:MAG: NAD(P)-dependent alcohol dehydrogenase [Pseudomonadales bacterium]|nr:NAD(P)-dependent alcohol dehydrogenase [Pseudomonadales bacterium]